jgi:hypothetical protein
MPYFLSLYCYLILKWYNFWDYAFKKGLDSSAPDYSGSVISSFFQFFRNSFLCVYVQSSRPKTMRDMKQIIKLKKMKKIIKMILTGFLTPVVCLTCLASSSVFRNNCFTLNTKHKIMLWVPNCELHYTLGMSKMVIVSFININFEIISQYLLFHGVSVFVQRQISL